MTKGCDVVKIPLQKPGYSEAVEITACTSPVICSRLPTIINTSKYTHLEGLELADDYMDHKSTSIDILIGSDHYWSIVTGDLIAAEHGPVAVCSKFGWLLSGPTDSRNCSNIFHSYMIITMGLITLHLANPTSFLECSRSFGILSQ